MFKKVCVMILTTALLITSGAVYTPIRAAETDKESLTQANMTAVLTEVKKRIIIPEEYTEFSYSCYENTYGGEDWNFEWLTSDEKNYIEVTCNESFNITRYYDSKAAKTAKEADMIPVFLSEELTGVAKEYIRLFMPEEYENAEFSECRFSGMGSNIYNIYFNRIENGIIVTDNTIRVALSAITGELVSFNASWHFGIEIPLPENIISAEDAAEIIDKEVEMQLAYYTLTDYEPEYDDEFTKAYLAYTPSIDYLAVDAFTGKVYFTSYSVSTDGMTGNGIGAEEGFKNSGFTEAEQEKIEEFGRLIKREDAVKVITENEYLYIDESATQITAGLYKKKDSNGEERYVWDIVLEDPRFVDYSTKDTYRFYASASLDAETGTLLSYNARVKGYYEYTAEELKNVEIKYSVEERQQIFEEFLSKVAAEKAKNIMLSTHYEEYPIYFGSSEASRLYSMSHFSYIRKHEGIPYAANSLYGGVSALTGKIYRYGTNWNDNIEFISADSIISEEEAFDKYISLDGYEYIYEMVYNYGAGGISPEVRLVYRTSIYPDYINAVTGKQSYRSGKEYEIQNYTYEYSDIKGHEYEREIKLLSSMGIGFESSTFNPDNIITRDEFVELIKKSGYFNITEDAYVTGRQPLTRQIVAKYGVIACGYGEIAEMEDIFTTGCYDEKDIYKGYKGYMALAKGLGILYADEDDCIRPYGKYTRGEAAELLLELINIVCNN